MASIRRLISKVNSTSSLILPGALYVATFCTLPLIIVLVLSLNPNNGMSFSLGDFSFANYVRIGSESSFWKLIEMNVLFAIGVAALSVVTGTVIALWLRSFFGKTFFFLNSLFVLPKLANFLVIIYGLKFVLSGSGPVNQALLHIHLVSEPLELINSMTGVIIGKTYVTIPYAVVLISEALSKIPEELELAARSLGASKIFIFKAVILPLVSSSLQVSFLLSLLWSMAAFATPVFLGSPDQWMLSNEVQRQAMEFSNLPSAAVYAMTLSFCLILCFLTFELIRRIAKELSSRAQP